MPEQTTKDWKEFRKELVENIEELLEKNKEQEDVLRAMISILEYSRIKIRK